MDFRNYIKENKLEEDMLLCIYNNYAGYSAAYITGRLRREEDNKIFLSVNGEKILTDMDLVKYSSYTDKTVRAFVIYKDEGYHLLIPYQKQTEEDDFRDLFDDFIEVSNIKTVQELKTYIEDAHYIVNKENRDVKGNGLFYN